MKAGEDAQVGVRGWYEFSSLVYDHPCDSFLQDFKQQQHTYTQVSKHQGTFRTDARSLMYNLLAAIERWPGGCLVVQPLQQMLPAFLPDSVVFEVQSYGTQ